MAGQGSSGVDAELCLQKCPIDAMGALSSVDRQLYLDFLAP